MRILIRLFSILLTALLPLAALAGGISASDALVIGLEFLDRQGIAFHFDPTVRSTPQADDRGYYVFNSARQTGFVIVSADDRTPVPVLAYASKGTFDYDQLPPSAKAWMDAYTEAIKSLNANEVAKKPRTVNTHSAVEPLIKSTWGQTAPYNQQCPMLNGERTVTGCAATAMAQMMYYHQWPAKGKGSIKYTWKRAGKQLSRSFASSSYNWKAMTPAYSDGSTTVQKNAVAQLMRDCGYAQKMNYGTSSSSSYPEDIAEALTTYFDYNKNTVRLVSRGSDDEEWESMLREELDNRRPVFYAGYGTGGHAFVCDGYDQAGYFHFNFGWNGIADGYYTVASITPGKSDYSYSNMAVVGIKKPDVAVTSVRLNKASLIIKDNETFQLTATILPATATDKSVTWSSSNEAVATVDGNGLVTPGSVLGATTITCTSVSTPAKKATCRVTVKTSKVAVSGVRLNKTSLTIKDNETAQLTATLLPANATDKRVKWSSSDKDVATVDEDGFVKPGGKLGTAVITCTSVMTPTRKATCRLTVKTSKVVVSSLRLNKSALSVKVNQTAQLAVTVLPLTASDKRVVWSSSNEAIATVDADGVVTAHSPGTATVTCQSVWMPSKKALCRITVPRVATRGAMDVDDELNSAAIQDVQTFDVYDMHGKKVRSGVTSLDGLPKGIYIVNGKKIVR